MDKTYDGEALIRAAAGARERAYAPYSRFPVGAALLTSSGRVYTGVNIENASYGLTVCAERVALWKAVSEGEREFVALAVVGGDRPFTFPCGACLQVLAEFAPDLEIITGLPEGRMLKERLKDLLPKAFVL
ncbi:cytidine deaminase [Thermanaeromonas sp. C210]|uniref:cytidine deaminase n=1 Tax=Thermanaeromonas sp. C210 TaxID=2731925 RepID=UPI00155D50DC|nr:cytidine deaminase [Thermanaeromonas sp. C210]GFN22508.1 cytidine deaminase [Thermanaeromonas sp. C210]